MPVPKASAAALHDIPATVEFTLADGTRLTAAVRLSPRARRARLSLSPRGNLVLAVPLSMGPQQLAASLPLFAPWLERARNNQLRTLQPPQLPERIELPMTGETFVVTAAGDMAAGRRATGQASGTLQLARGARRVLLLESPGLLHLYGAVEDISLCAQALRLWGRKKAALLLPPFLEHLAASHGFALAGTSVRDQRSRWGSCSRLRPQRRQEQRLREQPGNRGRTLHKLSARIRDFFSATLSETPTDSRPGFLTGRQQPLCGTLCPDMEPNNALSLPQRCAPVFTSPEGRISLNWRALLLPVDLLEHLCWHELCHLRHMNHSAAYRAELAGFSPLWPEKEKALNAVWRGLPWWALPGDDAGDQD